jgi:putative CocE/NonD family hydrolase
MRSLRRTALLCALSTLAAGLALVLAPASKAAPDLLVTMPDGVQLAVSVRLPAGYVEGRRYPTVFEMSGYDGASAQGGTLAEDVGIPPEVPAVPREDSRQITERFEQEYVVVHASVRGTGCSGGQFDLFSWQTAEDGKWLIDQWVAEQPWSDGKVAIIGHSYGGITGLMVASARPEHLTAVSVSGLIDDLYRGLVYPGGVPNYGFPLLWTGAIRPVYDVGGGLAPGLVRPQDEDDMENRQAACAQAAATKSRTVLDDPIIQGTSTTDTEWFRSRSPLTYVERVVAPLHITGAYQDEQTGPRGPTHLWEQATVRPKRLLLLNGDHNAQNPAYAGEEVWADRKGWIDHFTRGGGERPGETSVTVLWEVHRDEVTGELVSNGRTDDTTWPLSKTTFRDWYLQPANGLAESPAGPASYPWVAGSPRQSWSYQAGPDAGPPLTTAEGPDQVVFRSAPMTEPLAVHGPITATLELSTTAPDTDLFVQLADEGPDGSRTYLQRGMLKASHRAIDDSRSDFRDGVLYRPWRPHTNPQPVTPGQAETYVVEVFPVGHVFRPGHRIVVLVHSPPLVDSYYAYIPTRAPAGVNTLLTGVSKLTLPVVPTPKLGIELACGKQESVRCIPPS